MDRISTILQDHWDPLMVHNGRFRAKPNVIPPYTDTYAGKTKLIASTFSSLEQFIVNEEVKKVKIRFKVTEK